jgi:trk system potassium uptake protein TrkH
VFEIVTGRPTRPPANRVVRLMRPTPEQVELRRPIVRRAHPPSPVILLWSLLGLIGAGTVLLMLPIASEPGQRTGFVTALFTATSAVCVTGLVVVDTQSHWSFFGEVVLMVLILIGGLGFLSSSTVILLLIGRRLSLRDRLLVQQGMGEGTLGSIAGLLRQIVIFALSIQIAGAVLLTYYWLALEGEPLGTALWYGLFHSVSAFNNAGFDLLGGFRSLTGHQDQFYLLTVVSILILLGAIGFTVIADAWHKRRFGRLALDSKFVLLTSGGLLAGGTGAIFLLEYRNSETVGGMSLLNGFMHAYFLTAARTAGFATIDVGALREETLFYLMGLMFVGGSAGSTAGGIKVNSLAVLVAVLLSASKGRIQVAAFQREIPPAVVMRALSVTLLAIFAVANIALVLTIVAAFTFVDLLFESVSAFGTVGYSTGITRDLPVAGKLMIILAMFVGRLGPLTIAFALTRREREGLVRYPEDSVRIG